MPARFSIGMHFGAESVRVVVANIAGGAIAGQADSPYRHGVIAGELIDKDVRIALPPDYALGHPQDWLDSACEACRAALQQTGASPQQVIGVGVAFTSCTMLAAFDDGTPVCLFERFDRVPLAYPKLPMHHAARAEAERMNQVARQRNEPWLARCGGAIDAEWFFPKLLETLDQEPGVHDIADLWLEAGDWLVWQLTSGPFPACSTDALVRSKSHAGFKAQWSAQSGYPSRDFFAALHPRLADVVETKLPGAFRSPGQNAGGLTEHAAQLLGLAPETAVSCAIIDIHATVCGAGVASPSTMALVLEAGACQLMNSRVDRIVPGLANVVADGNLPGYFGYETRGATPTALNRELIEASAFGLRRIVEALKSAGVPVRRFVATGEAALRSPRPMQIYADVLNERIAVAASDEPVALGAAILGCLAAGEKVTGYAQISQAIHTMARQRADVLYRPDLHARRAYDELYRKSPSF